MVDFPVLPNPNPILYPLTEGCSFNIKFGTNYQRFIQKLTHMKSKNYISKATNYSVVTTVPSVLCGSNCYKSAATHRLRPCLLLLLLQRSLRGTIIEVFKYLNEFTPASARGFFNYDLNDRTRNNGAKLIVKHLNKSVAQHCYPIKITLNNRKSGVNRHLRFYPFPMKSEMCCVVWVRI